MSEYGRKQLDVIRNFGRQEKVCHVGVFGCGKTHSIMTALGILLMTLNENKVTNLKIALIGKTLQAVKRNMCDVLAKQFGEDFRYSRSQKDGFSRDAVLFNQNLLFIGVNDSNAETRYRGLSDIFCVIIDEAVLVQEETYKLINSRIRGSFTDYQLSVFGQLGVIPCFRVLSTNPDHPEHWLKKLIDSNYFDSVVNWTIQDACWNGAKEYYDGLLKLYPAGSIDRLRYLEGRWVAAEGSIFTYFLEHKDSLVTNYSDAKKNDIAFVYAGLDFGGNKSGSSLVFTGFYQNIDDGMIVLQSNKLIAAKGEIDPTRLNQWCIEQFRLFRARYPNIPIIGLDCDCAEQYLEQGVRIALNSSLGYTVPVGDSLKGSIIDRVKFIQKMFALQKLHIVGDMAPEVVNSLSTLVWDEHSQKDTVRDKGDTDNDTFDGLCYSFTRQMSRFDFL